MRNKIYLFFAGVIAIFVVSFIIPGYFLPLDILRNIPATESEWITPKNSLLADPIFQFEPWRIYAKERILKGEFPLWNLLNGQGSPFFANSQTAVLYPLNFLYYVFPAKFALLAIPFFKLYFFAWFTYLYLKSLGCQTKVGIFGALAASSSAFFIAWLLWPHTSVFLLLPLILYFTEKIKGKKNTLLSHMGISFGYFFAILGGHPETLFHIGIIHVLYMFFRLNLKEHMVVLFWVFVGFLMGAVQLLPFIEYLLNSHELFERSGLKNQFYLPFNSAILNVVPFLFGAPHMSFYKPIASFTNFQETIGGYVGPAIFLLALFFSFYYFKDKIVRMWAIITLLFTSISYNLLPVSMLPFLNTSTNHRLIGFAAFGLIIVVCQGIHNELKQKKIKLNTGLILCSIFILIISSAVLFSYAPLWDTSLKEIAFLSFLRQHALLLLTTSFAFFALYRKRFILLLVVPVLFQTAGLFWNYNPIVGKEYYYPESTLVQKIKNLPKGTVLEVGNPILPENLNIAYGISHAENYDALEVKAYKKEFNELFPKKNHWGNVDEVKVENLQKLGIRYVLSDFDINLSRQKVQPDYSIRLPALTSSKNYITSFKGNGGSIKQIRLLTANFNRINTCAVQFHLVSKVSEQELLSQTIDCKGVRDYMYYTVSVPEVYLEKDEAFIISVSSGDATPTNTITFWGDMHNRPYVEVFYEQENAHYKLLYKGKDIFVWEVPNYQEIELDGAYTILEQKPEQIKYLINSNKAQEIIIKKTNYPGWEAIVNNREVPVSTINSFIKVPIGSGTQLVELSYRPKSVLLGLLVTIVTFFILSLTLARSTMNSKSWKNFRAKWEKWARRKIRKIPQYKHFFVFFMSTLVSSSMFFLLIKVLKPKFTVPLTTAINWLTVNQYPKQQDYMFLIFGSIFIFIGSVVLNFSKYVCLLV